MRLVLLVFATAGLLTARSAERPAARHVSIADAAKASAAQGCSRIELFDYGIKVDADPPPADQVETVDLSELRAPTDDDFEFGEVER